MNFKEPITSKTWTSVEEHVKSVSLGQLKKSLKKERSYILFIHELPELVSPNLPAYSLRKYEIL